MTRKTLLTIIILIIIAVILFVILLTFWFGRRVSITINKDVQGLDEELQEVFCAASLAPNSHNIQSRMVTVYPKDERITIRTDENRRLAVVDPKDRELYISLGCYVETLIQALNAYGYDTEYSYDIDGHQCDIIYKKNGARTDSEKINLINKRHTDKRPYISGKSIDGEALEKCTDENSNVLFYDIDDDNFEKIGTATMEAYKKQAYDKNAAEELSGWLRLSDRETLENKDGLSAELLGISGLKKVLYYLFTDHESAVGDTFARQGIATCEQQVYNSSGFIVISGSDDEASLVECGRETVRLWLALTENGISVQPLSYAIEDDEYRKAVADVGGSLQPQMLLRVGYVDDYGENAGIRRDLPDYITVVD
ncbi:MAG: hypothetical protein K5770_18660 [Lachnospiraceae bacterium]|nr:hypothetical protein [Lachnospiraceae bacterium]